MKKIIFLLLFLPQLMFAQNDCEQYGNTWTIIYQANNKLDANIIKYRYKLANIGQEINTNEQGYYIELSYCDDNIEKFWKHFKCIPKYKKKRIQVINFLLINEKAPLYLGNGLKLIF